MKYGQGGRLNINRPNWRYRLPRNATEVPKLRIERLSDYATIDLTLLPILHKGLTQIPGDYLNILRVIEEKAGYKERVVFKDCKHEFYVINSIENHRRPSQILGKIGFRFGNKIYTMHVDKDNIYFYAMRAMTIMDDDTRQIQSEKEGIWYEFREFDQVARVPDALPIGLSSKYEDLKNVMISSESLFENVKLIRDFFRGEVGGIQIKHALELFWVFLMEGSRFSPIRDAYYRCLTHPNEESQSRTIGSRGWDNLIFCWGWYSGVWSAFILGDSEDEVDILDSSFVLEDVEFAFSNLRIVKLCNRPNRKFRVEQVRILLHYQENQNL